MNIVTITLNPAFDIHCFCEEFYPFCENLAKITSTDVGGKGINISRALTANGVENTAVVALGEENADEFRKSLSEYGMKVEEILVKGRIRENITLHTSATPETRISFPGFASDDSLLTRVKNIIWDKLDNNTTVTFTGSIPSGIALEAVKQMLLDIKSRGAKIVIDSKSFTLQDLIDCRPWLIKPNDEEIVEYAGSKIDSLKGAADEAEKIRRLGIENVMITLGSKGAALACEEGSFIADAPSVNAVSTIGAGDSTIAGFLVAIKSALPYSEALKTGVGYGSGACMTEGTAPPTKEDIDALLKKTLVKQIETTRNEL